MLKQFLPSSDLLSEVDEMKDVARRMKVENGNSSQDRRSTCTSSIFSPPSASSSLPLNRKVDFSVFRSCANTEFSDFMQLSRASHGGSYFQLKNDDFDVLQFVIDADRDYLADLLSTSVQNMDPSCKLTSFQRLSLAMWFKGRDKHISVFMSENDLREVSRSRRKRPIQCYFSALEGEPLDVTLVNLETRCGKTAWTFAASLMVLRNLDLLSTSYKKKKIGLLSSGPCAPQIVPLAIFAVPGNVFDHFKTTAEDMLSCLPSSVPVPVLWTTFGKKTSVKIASEMGRDVIWIIPVNKIWEALTASPQLTVSVLVLDELSSETPLLKGNTSVSPVLKKIISQATPENLARFAGSKANILGYGFEKGVIPPNHTFSLVRGCAFKEAETACEHYCKLHLMSLTEWRDPIARQLMQLVPTGLSIFFARCKRVTLGSYLNGSDQDLVPASLQNVLLKLVQDCRYPFLKEHLDEFLQDISVAFLSPEYLLRVLNTLHERIRTQVSPTTFVSNDVMLNARDSLSKVMDRVQEFSSSCPICMNNTSSITVLQCCSYCICADCMSRLPNFPNCPFCRTPIPKELPSSSLPSAILPTSRLPCILSPEFGSTVEDSLAMVDWMKLKQEEALILSLKILKRFDCLRPLVIVNNGKQYYNECSNGRVDLNRIEAETGFTILDSDSAIGGKGTKFAVFKRIFDDMSSPPVCLYTCNNSKLFLSGTNLHVADCIVSVGSIPNDLLVQGINRVFRPSSHRDNSKFIPFVKIFSDIRPVMQTRN